MCLFDIANNKFSIGPDQQKYFRLLVLIIDCNFLDKISTRKKIKYKDNIFVAKGDRINGFIDYVCEELDYCFFHYIDWDALNDEVEIIEEDKKDEEIEIYVNGKKVDITDIYEPLKQGEYIYKENGKWYVHKLKNVSFVIEEDKKIEKNK